MIRCKMGEGFVKLKLKRKPFKEPWRLVERSFKQYRDRRLTPSLPRLKCLEEDQHESGCSGSPES